MLKGKTVFVVLALIAVLVALVIATHGEGGSVIRRLLPAIHGDRGGHR